MKGGLILQVAVLESSPVTCPGASWSLNAATSPRTARTEATSTTAATLVSETSASALAKPAHGGFDFTFSATCSLSDEFFMGYLRNQSKVIVSLGS